MKPIACCASSSPIIPFPKELVREFTVKDAIRRSVQGLDNAVARTFAEGKTFSKLGLPWARAGAVVNTADYTWFPAAAGNQPRDDHPAVGIALQAPPWDV